MGKPAAQPASTQIEPFEHWAVLVQPCVRLVQADPLAFATQYRDTPSSIDVPDRTQPAPVRQFAELDVFLAHVPF